MFILASDYEVLITSEQLGQITENQNIINECLEQSYEEVKEFLRHRFNIDFDMRSFTVPADITQVTATLNDRIYDNLNFKKYKCILDAVSQPITNTTYFQETDDRNKKLVQITIDVFLYHLHTRLNPRNIPQHRKIRYDGDGDLQNAMSAIKWLMLAQKGQISPNLTILTDEKGETPDTAQSIIYGKSPNDFNGLPTNYNSELLG